MACYGGVKLLREIREFNIEVADIGIDCDIKDAKNKLINESIEEAAYTYIQCFDALDSDLDLALEEHREFVEDVYRNVQDIKQRNTIIDKQVYDWDALRGSIINLRGLAKDYNPFVHLTEE